MGECEEESEKSTTESKASEVIADTDYGVTEACGFKLKRGEIIAFMMLGNHLIWKSALIFYGGREIK